MALSFLCGSERRRALLRAQTGGPGDRLDGIDLLLVLDEHEDPGGEELRQQVLLVRLLYGDQLASLSAANVEVTGGVRVPNPRVSWAIGMPSLDPTTVTPPLSPAAQTWLSGVMAATEPEVQARTLVVFLEQPGDFSTYRLRLKGDDLGFHDGFDVRSVELDFSFKVECPTAFDCKPREECPPVAEPEPDLDYLARDFPSFRQLMLDRLALLQPQESSRAPATLRTTLVEVLAYAADRAAYHQDAVGTEAYLGTARLRQSVRRHARLLDYHMHDGCNARTFVHLELDDGVRAEAGSLRAGTIFFTVSPDVPTVAAPHQLEKLPRGVLGFQALMNGPVLSAAHNQIALYTWGDEDCCLQAGATSVDLLDDGSLELARGDLLLFEQVRSPTTGMAEDADPDTRWVVRLTEVSDPIADRLVPGVQVRRVSWAEDDAPDRDVPIVGDPAVYLVARGNLVLVDHGIPVQEEPVLETRGRNARVFARLQGAPLTFSQPLELEGASARALLRQDARAATARITLQGEGETWTPARDLLASAASATEFVVEMGDDRTAWLRFGDDDMARRPSDLSIARSQSRPVGTEAPFVAAYRLGTGAAGNVGSGAIRHVVADPAVIDTALTAAITNIYNPVPAVGGTEPERSEEVKLYAPFHFRRQERAVTAEDWAEVAGRHPLVTRAKARFRWVGSFTTVFVHLDLVGGASLTEALEAELTAFLDRFRMAGMDLAVRGPVYVPLDIALSVCVEDGFFPEEVEAALLRTFGSGLLSDGTPAFFHPDRFTFGQSVYLSALLARAMQVPGVRWLDATPTDPAASVEHRFKRLWAPDDGSLANGRVDVGDFEIARCDSDPNAPEHGQVRFYVRHRTRGAA